MKYLANRVVPFSPFASRAREYISSRESLAAIPRDENSARKNGGTWSITAELSRRCKHIGTAREREISRRFPTASKGAITSFSVRTCPDYASRATRDNASSNRQMVSSKIAKVLVVVHVAGHKKGSLCRTTSDLPEGNDLSATRGDAPFENALPLSLRSSNVTFCRVKNP